MKEYWLFSLMCSNDTYKNVLCIGFPTREELLSECNGKEYFIIHAMQLTEEQFYKLKSV